MKVKSLLIIYLNVIIFLCLVIGKVTSTSAGQRVSPIFFKQVHFSLHLGT